MRIRGYRMYDMPENYTVLDTETTGFDPGKDRIIEISALKVRNNTIIDTFSTLVNPGINIPAHITKITGIDDSMVSPSPAIEQIISEIVEFIGDDIILGHNVAFDLNFLTDNSHRILGTWVENNYVDTYYWAMELQLPVGSYRLSSLKTFFNIETEGSHRALADCMTTMILAGKLKEIEFPVYHTPHHETPSHTRDLKISLNTDLHHGDIDMNNMLCGKKCVFTGELEKFTRNNAKKAAEALGGICVDSVSSKTDFLILGNNDYNPSVKEGKSTKQRKAEELILKGCDIRILSEDVFCEILKMSNYLLEEN